jgi:uncharacterized protein YbjT (DUF2867 family)
MTSVERRPTALVVGGTGGLLGRALLPELSKDWSIRSLHRHPVPAETAPDVEWMPGDASTVRDWSELLRGTDLVVNLAWYRHGPDRRFRPLADGLLRLVAASRAAGVERWIQVSVPDAPPELETGLPYLVHKRRVDRAVAESGLSYRVVRPSMVFGPDDKLLTVMLRTMARYHRFPMFGDGNYHVSPVAATDVARIVRREAGRKESGTVSAAGPVRWRYRDLTDRMFRALGRPPRYFRLSPQGARRLARLLESVGSSLLYEYEVTWLLSDRLGPPSYDGLEPPLTTVEPFLDSEARRYRQDERAE